MKREILLGLFLSFILLGCQKEDEVSPSFADRNIYSVANDSDDELTQLRYRIYTERGVPIFYNDTIAKEERVDRNGNTYMHYDVIRIGYAITSTSSSIRYVLPDDEGDVLEMVKFMDEYFLDLIPEGKCPLSYLLLDTISMVLNSGAGAVTELKMDNYFEAMTTTCLENIERVKDMTVAEKRYYAKQLAAFKYVPSVLENTENESYLLRFDSISFKTVTLPSATYMPYTLKYQSYGGYGNGNVYRTFPDAELFGFVRYRFQEGIRFFLPTKEQDRAAFIALIWNYTDREIREMYPVETYPAFIEKYELMVEMMKNAGVEKLIKQE